MFFERDLCYHRDTPVMYFKGSVFMQLDLGKNIRTLRCRDKKTQEAVADALGVTSQAVSRWESGGGYPDMAMIPSIANYFGVTIDELFGYRNEREERIQLRIDEIQTMRWKNNGVDVNLDETIALARNALVEFPGNERIMVCLASVLYTAGYSRYGEWHLTDPEGYDVYDTRRHRGYAEWREAITLYEKAIPALENGTARRVAEGELIQLYVNMGMYEKSLALAENAPGIYSTKEYMHICACDGKERVRAYGKAILSMVHASAVLMVRDALATKQNMTVSEKIESIRGAIHIFDVICTDGNYGEHNRLIARMYTQLSLYLWMEGKKDEAFEALEQSLAHFRQFERICKMEGPHYTAPLLRQVPVDFSRSPIPDPAEPNTTAASLYKDWPWWSEEGQEQVRQEIQADPRWDMWVRKCDQQL